MLLLFSPLMNDDNQNVKLSIKENPLVKSCDEMNHSANQKTTYFDFSYLTIFSSPEPKAHGELIVYQSSRRPCVHNFKH